MGLVRAATISAAIPAQISGLRMAHGADQHEQAEVHLLPRRGHAQPRALPDTDGGARATPPSFPPPGTQWADLVAEQRVGRADVEDVEI